MKITTMAAVLLVIGSAAANAQQASRYSVPEMGKKANYYENKAMDFLKDNRFAEAVLYSAIALNSDPKREQIRGAHKGITEGFQKAFESLESSVSVEKPKAEKFDGEDPDPVMRARFSIVDHYTMAKRIMDELQKVPAGLFKSQSRKTEDVTFIFKDYSTELAAATQAYDDGKPVAAELKYKMAEKTFADKSLPSAKKAARLYSGIAVYVPDYKDARSKYEQARELGTTNLAIAPFIDIHDKNKYGSIGASVTERAVSTLINDPKYRHEFFRILTNEKLRTMLAEQKINLEQVASEGASLKGVQALVTGQVSRIETSMTVGQPSVSELEKEITISTEKYVDSDGKTKERSIKQKVKGTYTACSKSTVVTVNGSLTIIDAQNHGILSTKSIETYGRETVTWARFSGDDRVLSKWERDQIREEPQYPAMNPPLAAAINDFVAGVVQQVNIFATATDN